MNEHKTGKRDTSLHNIFNKHVMRSDTVYKYEKTHIYEYIHIYFLL